MRIRLENIFTVVVEMVHQATSTGASCGSPELCSSSLRAGSLSPTPGGRSASPGGEARKRPSSVLLKNELEKDKVTLAHNVEDIDAASV